MKNVEGIYVSRIVAPSHV